jgi:hypothetical protein
MRLISFALLVGLSAGAQAAIENFDSASWLHHESLPSTMLTQDLVISVDAGASLKGVRGPNALQPGFDPLNPAEKLIIEPRNTDVFSLAGFVATDLFQMAEPTLKVEGFRDGVIVATQTTGQLWDDVNKNGVLVALAGFDDVDRVEISSNVTGPVSSDVFFFLESVAYGYPGEPVDSPFGLGGFNFDNIAGGKGSGGMLSIVATLLMVLVGGVRSLRRRKAMLQRAN